MLQKPYPQMQDARLLTTHRAIEDVPAMDGFDGPWVWDAWVADWWDGGVPMPMRLAGIDGESEGERAGGTWCIYRPGTRYGARATRGERRSEALWFSWTGEPPFLAGRSWALIADPERRVVALAREMHAAAASGGVGEALAAHGRLLAILGEFMAAAARGGDGGFVRPWVAASPEARPAQALLRAFDAVVAGRLGRPTSCAAVARELRISTSSLAHRLKVEAGTTPMARLRWLRIRAAHELLREPGAMIKAVARRVGFANAFHFSRVFRAATGMPPREYQRRARERGRRDPSAQTTPR